MNTILQGLAPSIANDCRVLILGSMPGAASLLQQQYYAYPRNRFWPLMAELCGFDLTLPYDEKMQALQVAGVGLWDVIGACERKGSLDTAIIRQSEQPNTIHHYIGHLSYLRVIALNGSKAAQAFNYHIRPRLSEDILVRLNILLLPSTSPANASFNTARLWQAWSVLKETIVA